MISIKEGCSTCSVQAQRLQESQLTIRGDGYLDPVTSKKSPSNSSNRFVSQSATLKELSVRDCKRAKQKTYSLSMIAR